MSAACGGTCWLEWPPEGLKRLFSFGKRRFLPGKSWDVIYTNILTGYEYLSTCPFFLFVLKKRLFIIFKAWHLFEMEVREDEQLGLGHGGDMTKSAYHHANSWQIAPCIWWGPFLFKPLEMGHWVELDPQTQHVPLWPFGHVKGNRSFELLITIHPSNSDFNDMFSPFLHVFVLTLESDYIGFIIILVCLCLWPYHMTLLVIDLYVVKFMVDYWLFW